MPSTRKGKIARLPHTVREELNARLHDNQDGTRILKWVNESQELRGAAAISPQNLSEWRAGGFADWMEKQDKVERTKQLAEYCLRIGAAGGGSMDLPAAIAGGQIMEVLEEFDPTTLKALLADKPETWLDILDKVASLQRAKAAETKAKTNERQNDRKLDQNDEVIAMDRVRLERSTCELFVKWYANERAREIMENKALKPDVQMDQLRALMFGEVEDGEG
jgi:hypothetical protein